ncbi:MAG: ABC transporter ATP-binding protein [Synergistaceae bacterium]|jgi:peptide/nickel transport system ATP-binding protein|nr:ABC transporter ATP-binding protein [Synergistaceae bacterium]
MMEDTLLEIENLHVEYRSDENTVFAVNGLNLRLKKGITLGLVGETGAGKTSAALSIMRLLPERVGVITQGRIQLTGIDVIAASEARMRDLRGEVVSMIFQDPMTSLNPLLPVGDQIEEMLLLHNRSMSKEERANRVDDMLKLIGISPSRKYEFPYQFSGGMKQRIVIAIAMACRPMLLLADEPTTALDVTIQAQVLEMMNELKAQLGTSILLITHDLGVVAQTCDEVAVMYAGAIVEMGTTFDIFESDCHHPYTIGLFGSIPMIDAQEKWLKPIAGMMPDPTIKREGCAFCERCPDALPICSVQEPQLWHKGSHSIRCHLYTKQDAREGNRE